MPVDLLFVDQFQLVFAYVARDELLAQLGEPVFWAIELLNDAVACEHQAPIGDVASLVADVRRETGGVGDNVVTTEIREFRSQSVISTQLGPRLVLGQESHT